MPNSNINNDFFLSGENLTVDDVARIARDFSVPLKITAEVAAKIQQARDMLCKHVEQGGMIYGVNTGMGGFAHWVVPLEKANELQMNLINGIATNVGDAFSDDVTRAAMLSVLHSMTRGTSAFSLENFQKLLLLFNSQVVPVVPSKGSLGASGDLGPLACIALVNCGLWKAKYQGEVFETKEIFEKLNLEPMKLGFKEGLSLVNRSSMMAGKASLLVHDCIKLMEIYELVSALSIEVLQGKRKQFDPRVHHEKPHQGQQDVAQHIFDILSDSSMVGDCKKTEQYMRSKLDKNVLSLDDQMEDAYTIRCTPHVLGAVRDGFYFAKKTVENELNSSNDNPLFLVKENDVFHSGHFHGQYLSMAMDYLSICLTVVSNMADRRIDRFMKEKNSYGLPPFLCQENPGLRFGLMGSQFLAASLTAENRASCVPMSIQTLPTTGDFQDIVSFGLVAARKARQIFDNVVLIIATELICACQAATIRGKNHLSTQTLELYEQVRNIVPYLDKDHYLTEYVQQTASFIRNRYILQIN